MTRDEALKVWLPVIQMGVETMPECKEALDMAIDAMRKYEKIVEIVDKWNEGIYDDEGLSHTEVMELVSDEVYGDGDDNN